MGKYKLLEKLNLDKPQMIVLGLLVFIVMWFVGNGVYNAVNAVFVKTYVIESELERRFIDGYAFLRAENDMIVSSSLGEIKKIKKEGTRVAKNHAVLSVLSIENNQTTKKEFYAPISGILSYHIDGYELLKSLEDIRGLDFAKIYESQKKFKDKLVVTEKGERIAKIIDNLKPVHIYMTVPKTDKAVFEKIGDIVRVDFLDLGETTKAEVISIKENQDKKSYFCEFELISASDKLLSNRILSTEIYILKDAILEISAGTIVPYKDTMGVYILNDGIVAWRPLEVLKQNGNRYFCKPLPEGTEIILNPNRVDVGDIL